MAQNKKITDAFQFVGPITNKDLPPFLQSADLFVNMSHTGSLDKAVLEAMACGLKILTSNEAFKNVVPEDNFTSNEPNMIAEKIERLAKHNSDTSSNLAEYVAKNHDLGNLVDKIKACIFIKRC